MPLADRSFTLVLMVAVVAVTSPSAMAQKGRGSGGKKKQPPMRIPESVRRSVPVDMQVAPLDTGDREAIRRYAAGIDRLVGQMLAAAGQSPNRRLDDEQYVRRMYLELGGRIPTLEETRAFLDDRDDEKYDALVDSLLQSPDYVSHFYNYWADILRLTERPQPNIVADPYLAWIKQSIASNKPYDEWVYEMLTADGKIWENPAVGFQLRDEGMPLAYVDNTVRVFLGTQVGCAQCHGHPFDVWTQRQFYELAAYTAGTTTKISRGDPGFEKSNPANELINQKRKQSEDGKVPGPFQRVVRANMYRVKETQRKLQLPHDYAYGDGEANEVVEPAVLWGAIPANADAKSRRDQFARWLTDSENPQFAKTIGNRLWAKMMGVGIVEPVDDFRDGNSPTNAALLEYLIKLVKHVEFDMRQTVRTIAYTEAYRRQAEPYDPSSDTPFCYAGPRLRRMTAEQTWDSILTLAVYNPWPFQRPAAEEIASAANIDFASADLSDAEKAAEAFEEKYFMGTYRRTMNQHAYKGQVLVRASELPTPLPLGHFLRQFGQSDRETIAGSTETATVPQILTMFNGPITHMMLERGSKIYDGVMAAGPQGALDAIFLSVLSRKPTKSDRSVSLKEIRTASTPARGIGNVIWALLNTREFLFIQ